MRKLVFYALKRYVEGLFTILDKPLILFLTASGSTGLAQESDQPDNLLPVDNEIDDIPLPTSVKDRNINPLYSAPRKGMSSSQTVDGSVSPSPSFSSRLIIIFFIHIREPTYFNKFFNSSDYFNSNTQRAQVAF